MKIKEFEQIMNENKGKLYSRTDTNAVTNFVKKTLEVKEYLPIIDKMKLCNKVVSECTEEEFGVIKVDSFKRYFLFTVAVLQAYTTLEFSENALDMYAEYDLLCETGMLDIVISTFEKDYRKTNDILNMMCGDIIENNNNIANVVGKNLNDLSGSFVSILNSLQKKIEDFDLDLDKLDIEKLQKFISNT